MTSPGPERLYLGWQYATPYPDPGPPPRRPTPPEAERLNPDWASAQRREEAVLNRPLKAAFTVALAAVLVLAVLGAVGVLGVLVAGLGVCLLALVAAVSGYAIWQGERALRARLACSACQAKSWLSWAARSLPTRLRSSAIRARSARSPCQTA